MKIGIIAPSPVPFVIGGAENLWAGMVQAFNRRRGIECELLKLPSPERTLSEVLASYRRFAQLDLDHFDLLISTKYPAWAVSHPNHLVYLQHKLRGLYDTYPGSLPTIVDETLLRRAGVPRYLWRVLCDPAADLSTLDIAIVAGQLLDAVQGSPDPSALSLPGPLSRAFVHLLDRIALQPARIHRYAAISRTVAERTDYFPAGVSVEVMHHPSSLDVAPADPVHGVSAPDSGAIFSASRLDGPKRIDLIVDAWLRAGITRPLRIAGDGPQREALQTRAAGHAGVQFLGRLTDHELAREYAQSAFVTFVPYQEDYGLITIEAMAARKPVLTTSDAGGVTELVEQGVNGLVVAPTAEALAVGMRQLDLDPALIAAMGDAGFERVAGIHWDGLVDFLLRGAARGGAAAGGRWRQRAGATAPAALRGARPRYVVVNTFALTPVTSGGQVRLYGLYRALARHADIHFVNLGGGKSPHTLRELDHGLIEEVAPRSAAFLEAEHDLQAIVNASVGDLSAALYPNLLEDWVRAIAQNARHAQAVICSHPYGYPAVVAAGYRGELVYEAHNVERDLKLGIYAAKPWPCGEIERIERECARASSHVTACSHSERERLIALYGIRADQCAVIANGIDLSAVPFAVIAARRALQRRWRLQRPVALFIGSAHQPNVEAAQLIVDAAGRCPEIDMVLMGSVCHRLDRGSLPRNLRLLGVVGDTEKALWLKVADIGLNPIISGAGTNLKLAEYAAAGLPIISTHFGARGGVLLPGVHVTACDEDPAALAVAIRKVLVMTEEQLDSLVLAAWQRVRQTLDWQRIAEDYADFLRS